MTRIITQHAMRDLEKGTPAAQGTEADVDTTKDTPDDTQSAASPVKAPVTDTTQNKLPDERAPNVVTWDGSDDPENPMNWSHRRKVWTVVLVSTWTFLTPLASSMVAPATMQILVDFNSTDLTLGAFIVSVYILGYAVGPLLIAPISELYGRMITYHICNVFFVLWTLACAFAPNLNALLAFRFFQGVAGVCPLTIGSGTIGDLIPNEKRGKYMAGFSIGPLLGPVVGPIAGAFLSEKEGWRWVFRVLTVASGLLTVFTAFVMRESYAPVVLRHKVRRLQRETGNMSLISKLDSGLSSREVFLRAIVRPTKMLLLSPIVFLMSLYMAVVYGYLYLLFTTITTLYIREYHFTQGTAGLSYLGIGVGMLLGLFAFGATSDRIVTRLTNKHGGERKPEYRLPPMMIGAALVPIGLFWYGWSAQAKLHYIMPIIGTGLVGCGLLATFMPIGTYLVDSFTIYAASAMAANTVLRSLVGAFLPLAGPSMYKTLGLGWGNSLLAFIALALWPVSLGFYVYGERIRTSKRFKVEF